MGSFCFANPQPAAKREKAAFMDKRYFTDEKRRDEMKRRRWFRSLVAALAMTSMLLESTVPVLAVEASEYADASVTENGTEVYVDEGNAEAEENTEVFVEQVTEDASTESDAGQETSENGEPSGESEEPQAQAEEPAEQTEEPAEQPESTPEKAEALEVSDGRIRIAGYDSIYLALNTDRMTAKDSFRLSFTGFDGSESYDGALNGTLNKADGRIFRFENLAGKDIEISAASDDGAVTFEYRTREDGYPEIVVISPEETEPEKRLAVSEDGKGLEGEGLDSLTVQLNTDRLADSDRFNLILSTNAEARYQDEPVSGAIEGLGRSAGTLSLSHLEKKSFIIYVAGETSNTIAADYSVVSEEGGYVQITVYQTDEAQTVKRVYEYEDDDVKVTAAIEKADAIPDDAYFSVKKIEPESEEYDYDAYMEALNANEEGDFAFNNINTLLYDIAFYTDDTMAEEIEPEEGAVRVSIQFKKDQLNDGLNVGSQDEIEILHLSEDENTINIEPLTAEISGEQDELTFETDSFSIYVLPDRTDDTYVIEYEYKQWNGDPNAKNFTFYVKKSKLGNFANYINNVDENNIVHLKDGFVPKAVIADRNSDQSVKALGAALNAAGLADWKEDEIGRGYTRFIRAFGVKSVGIQLDHGNYWVEDMSDSFIPVSNIDEIKVEFPQDDLSTPKDAQWPKSPGLGITSKSDVAVVEVTLSDNKMNNSWDQPYHKDSSDIAGVTLVNGVKASLAKDGGNDSVTLSLSDGKTDFGIFEYRTVEKTPGTNRSLADILGEAVNYGITANTINFSGKIESNFATGLIEATGTHATQGVYSGMAGDDIVGDISGSGWFTEASEKKPFTIYLGKNSEALPEIKEGGNFDLLYRKITDGGYITLNSEKTKEELAAQVRDMIGAVKTIGSNIAAETALTGLSLKDVVDDSDPVHKVIDLTGYSDGTYYVNLEAGEYAKQMTGTDQLIIKLKDSQRIVFNVPDPSITLNQLVVDLYVNGQSTNEINSGDHTEAVGSRAERVVWNLYNAGKEDGSNVDVTLDRLYGVVLAPYADVLLEGPCAGWLVAKTVKTDKIWCFVSGGTTGTVTDTPATLSIPVKKSFAVPEDWPEGKGFNFTIEALNDGPLPAVTATGENEETVTTASTTAGPVTKDSPETSFAVISYDPTADGTDQTYIYKISEVEDTNGAATIKYADPVFVKVVVQTATTSEGDGTNIQRTASVKSVEYFTDAACVTPAPEGQRDAAYFVNELYKDTQNDSLKLWVKKTFTGRTWTRENFTFTLTGSAGKEGNVKAVPMPEKTELTIKKQQIIEEESTVEHTVSGNTIPRVTEYLQDTFGIITFEAAEEEYHDVYVYTISEKIPAADEETYDRDITYDQTRYQVTVTVDNVYDTAQNKWVVTATPAIKAVKGDEEETYTAEKKKNGEEEDGYILPFENVVEAGSLIINKKVIGGYWSIGCEVPFVPPIDDYYNKKEYGRFDNCKGLPGMGGSDHRHRQIWCGDPTNFRIYLNDNGEPESLWEIRRDNLSPCECKFSKVVNKDDPMDPANYAEPFLTKEEIAKIKPGDLVCYTTFGNGNQRWQHFSYIGAESCRFRFTIQNKDTGEYYDENGHVVAEENNIVYIAGNSTLKIDNMPAGTYIITEVGANSTEIYQRSIDTDGNEVKTKVNSYGANGIYNVLVDGKNTKVSDNVGETGMEGVSSEITVGGTESGEITFTNTRDKEEFDLSVRKTVNGGPTLADENGKFEFKLYYCDANGNIRKRGTSEEVAATQKNSGDIVEFSTITLDGGMNGGSNGNQLYYYFLLKETGSVKNIDRDSTSYLIRVTLERKEREDGCGTEWELVDKKYKVYDPKHSTNDYMPLSSDSIVFNNIDKRGIITVTKELVGKKMNEGDVFAIALTDEEEGKCYKINGSKTNLKIDKDGKVTQGLIDITPQGTETTRTVTFERLVVGKTYKVTEYINGYPAVQGEPYTVTITGGGEVSEDGISATFTPERAAANETSRYQFETIITNTGTGSLTLKKTLSTANPEPASTTFYAALTYTETVGETTVKYYYDNDTKSFSPVRKAIPLDAADASGVVIEKLPINRSYVVYETDANGNAKAQDAFYRITMDAGDGVTADNATVDGVSTVTGTVIFTGDILDTNIELQNTAGSLKLTKLVDGDNNNTEDFYFTVQKGSTFYDQYAQEIPSTNPVKTITVKAGAANAVTIYNLPLGDYTITEAADTAGTSIVDHATYPYQVKSYTYTDGMAEGSAGTISLTAAKKDGEVTITNEKRTGSVTMTKKNNENETLSGIHFTLYRGTVGSGVTVHVDEKLEKNGRYSYNTSSENIELTTGSDGKIVVDGLPLDNYYFVEDSASDDYVVTTTETSVTVSGTSNEALNPTIDIINSKFNGGVRFKKIDADSKEDEKGLSGVSFTLYKKDGTKFGGDNAAPYVSGTNGWVNAYPLPAGEYYFLENETTGYNKNETKLTFTIHEDTAHNAKEDETEKFVTLDSTITGLSTTTETYGTGADAVTVTRMVVPNTREKGKATLHKVKGSIFSDINGQPLQDAEFTLYPKAGGNGITETTDASGDATFTDLEWGEYYVLETKAPDGYELGYDKTDNNAVEAAKKFVTIDADHLDVTIDGGGTGSAFVNQTKKTTIELTKRDATDRSIMLPGAEFDLYRYTGSLTNKNDILQALISGEITQKPEDKVNTVPLVTNTEGKITPEVEYISCRLYYFVETKAPTGYEISDTYYVCEVDGNGGIVGWLKRNLLSDETDAKITAENTRKTGTVTLIKVDENGTELTGEELYGAEFKLKKDGNTERTITINKDTVSGNNRNFELTDGRIVISGLGWGNYTFEEITPPTGYTTENYSITPSEVTIGNVTETGTGTVTFTASGTITITNKHETGSVQLTKVNSDNDTSRNRAGTPLQGAKFKLYDSNDNDISQTYGAVADAGTNEYYFTTGVDGKTIVVSGLPWGSYYFKEEIAPTYYQKSDDPIPFTVGKYTTVSSGVLLTGDDEKIENDRIYGKLTINKTGEDDKPLPGATFYITDEEGYNVHFTGDNGFYAYESTGGFKDVIEPAEGASSIEITSIPAGVYYVHEKKAPAGYSVNRNQKVRAEIVDESVKEVTFKNTSYSATLEFIKLGGGKRLGGAVFALEQLLPVIGDDGNPVMEGDTPKMEWQEVNTAESEADGVNEGRVTFTIVSTGDYKVYEKSAPAGYVKDTQEYTFTLTEDNKSRTVTLSPSITYPDQFDGKPVIINEQLTGAVKLVKKDENGSYLGGAKFTLYKKDGSSYQPQEEKESDSTTGEITFTGLAWGKYKLVETKAPEHYATPEDQTENQYFFTVDASNAGNKAGEEPAVFITSAEKGGKVVSLLDIANERIKGSATLTKKGKNKEGKTITLRDAVFELHTYDESKDDKDGGVVAGYAAADQTLVTDSKGEIHTDKDLPEGKYFFIEKTAPNGYELDAATRYVFTVTSEKPDVSGNDIQVEGNGDEKDGQTDGNGIAYNARSKGDIWLYKYETDNNGANLGGINGVSFKLEKYNWKFLAYQNYSEVESGETTDLSEYKDEPEFENGARSLGSNDDGYLHFDNLEWGTYRITEVGRTGYVKDSAWSLVFTIDENCLHYNTMTAPTMIPNRRATASVKLIKKDSADDKKLLEGAYFDLYQVVEGSDPIRKETALKTDGNGVITVNNLAWDEFYYFEETKQPAGYVKPVHPQTEQFKLTEDYADPTYVQEHPIVVTNRKSERGSITLLKTDADGNALTGAVFTLYDEDGNKILLKRESEGAYTLSDTASENTVEYLGTYAGNEEGKTKGSLIVSNLYEGTYSFKEVATPEGDYLKLTNSRRVTLTQTNLSETVTVQNDNIKVNARFIKKASVNGAAAEPLEDAVFKLWKKNAETGAYDIPIDTISSKKATEGEKGLVFAEGLAHGDYCFEEVSTPDNAYSLAEKIYFSIANDKKLNGTTINVGDAGDVVDYNRKGSVELTKTDDTGETIEGVKFTLHRLVTDQNGNARDGGLVSKTGQDINPEDSEAYANRFITTGSDGKLTASGLAWGWYYFKEESVPDNAYTFKDEINKDLTFEIKQSNAAKSPSVSVSTVNDRKPGFIEITKYGRTRDAGKTTYTKKRLEGVSFTLYELDENSRRIGEGTVKTTGEDGIVTFGNLTWGKTYTVVETATVNGYVIPKNADGSDKEYTYTIGRPQSEREIELEVVNEQASGSVKLLKVDATDNSIRLGNVAFDLFYGDGTQYNNTGVSYRTNNIEGDSNYGYLMSLDGSSTEIGPLPIGSYYFKEKTPPQGYKSYENDDPENRIWFSITYDQQVYSFTDGAGGAGAIKNERTSGKVLLTKTDDSGHPVKGAVFELKGTKNPRTLIETFQTIISKDKSYEVGKYTTDEDGILEIDNLPWDDYTLQEIKAPAGYTVDTETVYPFSLSATESSKALSLGNMTNQTEKGSVVLVKTETPRTASDAETPVAGAKFKLYYRYKDTDDWADVTHDYTPDGGDEFVTDDNGEIEISKKLIWGSYYFYETKPADNYEIPSEAARKSGIFRIGSESFKADGEPVVNVTMQNGIKKGYISLHKSFSGNEMPIKDNKNYYGGIAFTLYEGAKDADHELNTFTTDENGDISAETIAAAVGPLYFDKTYYFAETGISPEAEAAGYTVSSEVIEIKLSDKLNTEALYQANSVDHPLAYTLINSQITGGTSFTKTDASGQALSGIRFDLYTAAGASTGIYAVSEADGKVSFANIKKGRYYFKENEESAKVKGYTPDLTEYWFEITDSKEESAAIHAGNLTAEAQPGDGSYAIANAKQNGRIVFVKTADGAPKDIDAFRFALYKAGEDETPYIGADALMSDSYVKEITLATGKHVKALVVENLEQGGYYFKELAAANGYAIDENHQTRAFTIDESNAFNTMEQAVQTPLMLDNASIGIYFHKKDASGALYDNNAEVGLYKVEGSNEELLMSWKLSEPNRYKLLSITESSFPEGFISGVTYRIKEITPPAGYTAAAPIDFSFDEFGKLQTNHAGKSTYAGKPLLEMTDEETSIRIRKEDQKTDSLLKEAVLRLYEVTGYDEENNNEPVTKPVGDSWTTSEADHVINHLKTGTTYILREITAPQGYYKADDIYFTLAGNGEIQYVDGKNKAYQTSLTRTEGSPVKNVLIMKDRPIELVIYKARQEANPENTLVSGAELTLRNAKGEDIYTWKTADQNPVTIPANLLTAGAAYTIAETPAAGYTVPEDGIVKNLTVKVYDSEVEAANGVGVFVQTETVLNDYIKIPLSKQSAAGEELAGASLTLSKEVIIDETATKQPVYSYISAGRPVLLVGISEADLTDTEKAVLAAQYPDSTIVYADALEEGTSLTAGSYELSEDAGSLPDGYALNSTPVPFTIDADGTLKQGSASISGVTMTDYALRLVIAKVDTNGDYVPGAEMKLSDEEGHTLLTWNTEEVNPVIITEEPDISDIVAKLHNAPLAGKRELSLNGSKVYLERGKTYTIEEESAPLSYAKADPTEVTTSDNFTEKDPKAGYIKKIIDPDLDPGNTSVIVTKKWVAPIDLPTGYQYPTITIELYQNATEKDKMEMIAKQTLTSGNTACVFADLPEQRTDKIANYKYRYYVQESEQTIAGLKDEGLTIRYNTNNPTEKAADADGIFRYELENTFINDVKTKVHVTKKWRLVEGGDSYEDVTLTLYQNGVPMEPADDYQVTVENGAKDQNGTFTHTFENLPKYADDGTLYQYTVVESESKTTPASFTTEWYERTENGEKYYTFVNTPEISTFAIEGTKYWNEPEGFTHPEITIKLLRDGAEYKNVTISSEESSNKTQNAFRFEGLYEYALGQEAGDATDGHRYVYTLTEIGAEQNYTAHVYGPGPITGTGDQRSAKAAVVNTRNNEYISINGTKSWGYDTNDYTKHPAVAFKLYANGTEHATRTLSKGSSDTTYEFADLPKYDYSSVEVSSSDGTVTGRPTLIEYRVCETVLPNFLAEMTNTVLANGVTDAAEGYTVAYETGTVSYTGYDFKNTPTKVEITKVDNDTGELLAGAKFAIYDSDGKLALTLDSGNAKQLLEGLLAPGTYTLKETEAPTGYNPADDQNFTVPADGTKTEVEMRDTPIIGSLHLMKVDQKTQLGIIGATFKVYKKNGDPVHAVLTDVSNNIYRYTTDGTGVTEFGVSSNGTLDIMELPYGEYYVNEIEAPTGYKPKTGNISFSVLKHGVASDLTVENERKPGSVKLTKVELDMENNVGALLEGAKFELYSEFPVTAGQALVSTAYSDAYYRFGRYTTNVLGEIHEGGLPWGEYYFIETEAPEGYRTYVDTDGAPIVRTFTIDASNAGTEIDLGLIGNGKDPTSSTLPETPTPTPTDDPSGTPTPGIPTGGTGTGTPTPTTSVTPGPSGTATPTPGIPTGGTGTGSPTPTTSVTPGPSGTATPTPGIPTGGTGTGTPTPTTSVTPGPSGTATPTPGIPTGGTGTPTPTTSVTPGPTGTGTPTPVIPTGGTGTGTPTPTPGTTGTPTSGPSGTVTPTPVIPTGGTGTGTPTPTTSVTPGPTGTGTPTSGPSGTPGTTGTPTSGPSGTVSPTPTGGKGTGTPTPTRGKAEVTSTPTPTPTETSTPTSEPTETPASTPTPTDTVVVITVTPTATPVVIAATLTPTPTRTITLTPTPTPKPTAAVLGERRTKPGSVVQGVLGVRSAPTKGVLGERVGPATGDAANIALWIIILAACIGAIVMILLQTSKKRKTR
ncbi:MAG: Cna B-type domain-containing protein [Lachnospiraceae bacterium]|nr:Cna B-type domain-containing protein [Lachnospiraceae bacterium]